MAPPDNEAEQVIARIWEEVLSVTGVGRDNNFFDLGGELSSFDTSPE